MTSNNAISPAPSTWRCGHPKTPENTRRDDIRDRIDAALEKMRAQDMQVRAIYLTESDRKELGRAIRRDLGGKGRVEVCGYADHIVRTGKHSVIYSVHGVPICIPKKLSHRVAERKAT